MNIVLFIIAFLGFFALISIYINRRLISHLHLSDSTKHYLRYFLWINFLGIVGYMLARYFALTSNGLYFLFSLPIGILFLFFCTAVVYDVSRVGMERLPIHKERRNFFKKGLEQVGKSFRHE